MGPVDIIVEKNKIVNIVNVGYPGLAINDKDLEYYKKLIDK